MYAHFEKQAVRQETDGAEELVALDGLAGYLFVAEQWRRHPLPEEEHWQEARLWEQLGKQIGGEEAQEALTRASQSRPALAAYLAGVGEKRRRWHDRRNNRPPRPTPTYDELAARIADPTQTTRPHRWRHWARRLSVETLARLAQDLLSQSDRGPLLKMLHVFREKPFPLDISRLLALARGRDEELAEAARWALGSRSDPRIRALALELYADEEDPVAAAHLLRNNFLPGDYGRVERLVCREMPAGEFHHLAMLVRELIQAHPAPEASATLRTLYARGRCVLCRASAVELMLPLGPLPPWMREEGRWDADSETRTLTAGAAPAPQ